MTLLPPGAKVHLAFGFIDMRKGINGLAMLVQGVLRRRRETSTTASIPNRRLSVRLSGGAQSSSLLAKKDVSSAPRATGVRPRRHAGMRSVETGCSTDGTPLVMRSPFLRYSTGKAQTLARASVLALKLCTAYPQGAETDQDRIVNPRFSGRLDRPLVSQFCNTRWFRQSTRTI
jgi:hypothetical protein